VVIEFELNFVAVEEGVDRVAEPSLDWPFGADAEGGLEGTRSGLKYGNRC